MRRIGSDRINNAFYNHPADIWWDETAPLSLLQTTVNPARVGFFKKLIHEKLCLDTPILKALEIGCGGGILSEEIAHMGFETTGLDPSEAALEIARGHARQSGVRVQYVNGSGEALPFENESMDVIFCCDVLEHVGDLGLVIREIHRVLKPGGHFFYDTLNRTWFSWLVAIKIWQDWSLFAFMPKNLHIWKMFIHPRELIAHFEAVGLRPCEMTGIAPSGHPLKMLYALYRLKAGQCTLQEMASQLRLRESSDMRILYAGHAQKTQPADGPC